MIAKSDQKRVLRAAKWGAGILGSIGFVTGSVICLVYKLPIPPLFITEMGILLGGCLGALLALSFEKPKVPKSSKPAQEDWLTIS